MICKLKKMFMFFKEDVMKKLLVLLMVLGMCAGANAGVIGGLSLTVNGQNPDQYPGIVLHPSDTIEIDIEGDGTAPNPTPYLLILGPGSIDGGVILYDPGSTLALYSDAEAKLALWGMTMAEAQAFMAMPTEDGGWGVPGVMDFSQAEMVSDKGIPPATIGMLANSIIFHCEGPGQVLIRLVNVGSDDAGMTVLSDYDTLNITQIPEPVTVGLLGLGALFLRRRK
jgi:hypothetical protein